MRSFVRDADAFALWSSDFFLNLVDQMKGSWPFPNLLIKALPNYQKPMNKAPGHDPSQKNYGLGLMDGVACVLSVACLVGSAISWWSWPLYLRAEGYPLPAPLFWSAFNIGLILVASALTLPSAILIWKRRTR